VILVVDLLLIFTKILLL